MSTSWTVADKQKLLILLEQHGAGNLEIIQENMPTKTISEIRFICEKHSKLAVKQWCSVQEEKLGKSQSVTKWLRILKHLNNTRRGYIHDVISRVLRYIALYEKRTPNSQIKLRDCYLILSDISNGLAAKKLNDGSNYFLFECLSKLAEALKQGEIQSYKSYLKSIEQFHNLQGATTLNPLGIPKRLLKMTYIDKKVNII